MYIACPRCDWRPDASARWSCSCGHSWNTFQTHGVCPACGKAWKSTQCLACHQWSDHEDWYHDDDSPTVEEFIARYQEEQEPAPTAPVMNNRMIILSQPVKENVTPFAASLFLKWVLLIDEPCGVPV